MYVVFDLKRAVFRYAQKTPKINLSGRACFRKRKVWGFGWKNTLDPKYPPLTRLSSEARNRVDKMY
jgi:hypothetical protein